MQERPVPISARILPLLRPGEPRAVLLTPRGRLLLNTQAKERQHTKIACVHNQTVTTMLSSN